MADLPARHIGLSYDEFADCWSEHDDPDDEPTFVAVPVDEYERLQRCADILGDPEQLDYSTELVIRQLVRRAATDDRPVVADEPPDVTGHD